MSGPGKIPPAKEALRTRVIKQERQIDKERNEPSGEPIRCDHLVHDFKLGIASVDDSRGIGTVIPRTEDSRTRVRNDRERFERTDGREKKDQGRRRERVHLEYVEI